MVCNRCSKWLDRIEWHFKGVLKVYNFFLQGIKTILLLKRAFVSNCRLNGSGIWCCEARVDMLTMITMKNKISERNAVTYCTLNENEILLFKNINSNKAKRTNKHIYDIIEYGKVYWRKSFPLSQIRQL